MAKEKDDDERGKRVRESEEDRSKPKQVKDPRKEVGPDTGRKSWKDREDEK